MWRSNSMHRGAGLFVHDVWEGVRLGLLLGRTQVAFLLEEFD